MNLDDFSAPELRAVWKHMFPQPFDDVCKRTHTTLLGGTCPWCGQAVFHGKTIAEVWAKTERARTEEFVRVWNTGLPKLGDAWFAEKLAASQGPQSEAFILLQASCIRSITETVTRWCEDHPGTASTTANMVATRCLVELSTSFTGTTAAGFVEALKAEIIRGLDQMLGEASK